MKHEHKRIAFALITLLCVASDAMAGGTGGGFIQPLSNFIIESLKGYVGTAIGVSGLVYGLVAGVARGSLIGLGTGIGLAIGAYYGPDVISALSSATLMAF